MSNTEPAKQDDVSDIPIEFLQEVQTIDSDMSRVGIRYQVFTFARQIWILLKEKYASSQIPKPAILSTFFEVSQKLSGPLESLHEKK
jgi:hypothetical protein